MRHYLKTKNGFTLIEMIVSLGVFSVVITTSVGALMVLMSGNARLQSEQNIMTNLAFAVDMMTREIRTGTAYVCLSHPNTNGPVGQIFSDNTTGNIHQSLVVSPSSECPGGRSPGHDYQGVSFITGGSSGDRTLYFLAKESSDISTIKQKFKDERPQSILSPSIYIEDMQLHVEGSCPLRSGSNPCNGNVSQPTVTIYLKAYDKGDPDKKYVINTTVTQRTLDL